MATTTEAKPVTAFTYMSFDVVGTLIDFEGAIRHGLSQIAAAHGIDVDIEAALVTYRDARRQPGANRFPDDLARCYSVIAAEFGLPDTEDARRTMVTAMGDARPFPDSVEALARLGRHYKLVAMTNAQRWAFERYAEALGQPFHASFTVDDTVCEKPDPAFFRHVFDALSGEGAAPGDILHTAQSQYHDIGVSRDLGMTNVWIERRHDRAGYGGTIEPDAFTRPDYHFRALSELADAVDAALAGR
ncbi:HAD-IA family hydrolase [Roseivivax sediminis]|uniref:Putative hydrolase of the HAD superfamily n=1 Tax=Roseivivax sediminis TaxID=936889 RepID=A0A1I1TAL6_9RHOB|nr:HAD-IA family hydrolase [Roseivivax sediminis]SFD55639.1 putative hydrolase of the HAD superfamily [Roseivivax sediminis]